MTTNEASKSLNISNFEDSRLRQLEERLYRAQRARDNYLQNVQLNGGHFGKNSSPLLLELNGFTKSNRSKSADVRQQRSSISKGKTNNIYSVAPSKHLAYSTKVAAPPDDLLHMDKVERRSSERNAHLRQSLISRMRTSQHFWNISKAMERPYHSTTHLNTTQLPTLQTIPTSDTLLDSDMPVMDIRLEEIRQSLDNLKNFRLNMPSKEYFHSIYPVNQFDQLKQSTSTKFQPLNRSFEASGRGLVEVPSTSEILARILNMEFYIERRVREIIDNSKNSFAGPVNNRRDPLKDEVLSSQASQQQHLLNQPEPTSIAPSIKPEASMEIIPNYQTNSFSKKNEASTAQENARQEVKVVGQHVLQKTSEPPGTQRRIVFEILPEKSNLITPASNFGDNSLSNRLDQKKLEITPKAEESASSYNRMLELLKKPAAHYEVSTSSSSDTESSLGIGRNKTAGANKGVVSSGVVASKDAFSDIKSTSAGLQISSAVLFPSDSDTINKPSFGGPTKIINKENDSDSDFFN